MKKTLKPGLSSNKLVTTTDKIDKKLIIEETSTKNPFHNDRLIQLEEEVMGEVDSGHGTKSDMLERNLDQMINVLRLRLGELDKAANERKRYCEEDVNPNSQIMSKQAPKLGNEYDEVLPKSLKDTKTTHRDNLVSADNIHIDPIRLVIRTKATTERAKKLETKLEDSFGITNIREMTGKKMKTSHHAEETRRSELQKFELKKQKRMKLEKKLFLIMENCVSRSILDSDMIFTAPESYNIHTQYDYDDNNNNFMDWPIPVKPYKTIINNNNNTNNHNNSNSNINNNSSYNINNNSNSNITINAENSINNINANNNSTNNIIINSSNNDGDMDIELLLRYSLERINIPSNEKLFLWLIKNYYIMDYSLYLFWFIKLKLFQHYNDNNNNSSSINVAATRLAASSPKTALSMKINTNNNTNSTNNNNTGINAIGNNINEMFLLNKLSYLYSKILELLGNYYYLFQFLKYITYYYSV